MSRASFHRKTIRGLYVGMYYMDDYGYLVRLSMLDLALFVDGGCGMMQQFTVFNGRLLLFIEDDGRNEIMCLLDAQGEEYPA